MYEGEFLTLLGVISDNDIITLFNLSKWLISNSLLAKNKNAILLCEPDGETDPWPFKSLYEDGNFVMLSTEEYTPQ